MEAAISGLLQDRWLCATVFCVFMAAVFEVMPVGEIDNCNYEVYVLYLIKVWYRFLSDIAGKEKTGI